MQALPDFNQVTEDLYVGGRLSTDDWYILASLNITVNINLQAEAADRFSGTAPEVYLWLPTPDFYGPSTETLSVGTRFIHMMHQLGRRVYVHCFSGVGRAPALVIAYLVAKGATIDEAVALVHARHPRTRLSPAQVRLLHEFAGRPEAILPG